MNINHNSPTIESMVEARVPKQVLFYDSGSDKMCAGILYGDVVICACRGGVFEVRDILEETPAGQVPFKVFENWVDFAYEIGEME